MNSRSTYSCAYTRMDIEVYPLAYYKELNKVYKEAKTSPQREAVLCRENMRARKRVNMLLYVYVRILYSAHIGKKPGVLFQTVGLLKGDAYTTSST